MKKSCADSVVENSPFVFLQLDGVTLLGIIQSCAGRVEPADFHVERGRMQGLKIVAMSLREHVGFSRRKGASVGENAVEKPRDFANVKPFVEGDRVWADSGSFVVWPRFVPLVGCDDVLEKELKGFEINEEACLREESHLQRILGLFEELLILFHKEGVCFFAKNTQVLFRNLQKIRGS